MEIGFAAPAVCRYLSRLILNGGRTMEYDAYESSAEQTGNGPSKSERQWAMGCHLIALAGHLLPIASIIGPLVLWLIKREDGAFIDEQGKESLNFQISILVYYCISFVLIPLLGLGLLLLGVVAVFDLVCILVAAVKVSEGRHYRYPMCLRLIN